MLFSEFPYLFGLVLLIIFHHLGGIQAATTRPWWDRKSTTPTYKPNPTAKLTASYFFPYACTVNYQDKYFLEGYRLKPTWVSACTVLSDHWVATSTDNFNYITPDTKYFFYQNVSKLQVNAGTTYGAPSPTAKGMKNLVRRGVEIFATLTDSTFIGGRKSQVFTVSGAPDRKKTLEKDAKKNNLRTFEWGVAFLKVTVGFRWSSFLLPAPQIEETYTAIAAKVKSFLGHMEKMDGNLDCVLTGWNRETHRIGFFIVSYIPIQMCRATFCNYDTRTCLNFPNPDMHVCFKSTEYGSDACPEDRGSAVYCQGFGRSILAVLTSAPNCGEKSLPGVYTLINHVVHAYVNLPSPDPIKKLSPSLLSSFTLPPIEFDT